MKKKTLNRILLIVVLGIWAGIGFKLYKNFQFDADNEVVSSVSNSVNFSVAKNDKKEFELSELKQDPFLGRTVSSKTPKKKVENSSLTDRKVIKNPKESIPKVWPSIKYYGFVKNHSKKDKLGVVSIDNKVFRLRKGDEEREVRILQMEKHLLTAKFNNEIRQIKKK